ncbi:MAG TPA: ATP-binding cassette domain-containing protein [Sedimentisphaerales bacterium]|nr:ATP-binding cassette domain-containing protein [Sedimentisphaerales bacterium]
MYKNIIELEDVCVINKGCYILKDISLTIPKGRCCALIGPNGAGKSTLISVLAGYTYPSTGRVTIKNQTFGQADIRQLRENIGLIETSRIPTFRRDLTAREIIATGLFGTLMLPINKDVTPCQWEKVDAELKAFQLDRIAGQNFNSLSTGEKTKTLIARAIIAEPEVLILDEPTAGLDMAARAKAVKTIEELLKRENCPTVMIVSHHLAELPATVDDVILLKNGQILTKGKPEVIFTSENLSKLYNCQIKIINDNGHYFSYVSNI